MAQRGRQGKFSRLLYLWCPQIDLRIPTPYVMGVEAEGHLVRKGNRQHLITWKSGNEFKSW